MSGEDFSVYNTGGGMLGCGDASSKSSAKKNEPVVVSFTPFSAEVNCDPEKLKAKTWDEVAVEVIKRFKLGTGRENESVLRGAIVDALKKANGNKATPFADYSDSNYSAYLSTQCGGSISWLLRSVGAPPSLNLPLDIIYGKGLKEARKEIEQLKKERAAACPKAAEPAPAVVAAPPSIEISSLDLFSLPDQLIIKPGQELTFIVCGKEFSALPQVEVFGNDKVRVTEAALNAFGELVVTIFAQEDAEDQLLGTVSIRNVTLRENGVPILEQEDFPIQVTPKAEAAPVAVEPARTETKKKVEKPKVAEKPKKDKPKEVKPAAPKLPPCSDFPTGLQVKMKAQGKCQ